jgi:quercetin dioxygenase-like cupin family protein
MLKIKTIKSSRFYLGIVATTLLCASIQTISAQEKTALVRETLLENIVELPSNNIKAKTIRVIFPPAFKTPWHSHEGPGPRYVVRGKLKVIEEGKTNTYASGDVFWESGRQMSVENIGESQAEIIIFELAPAH